MVPVGNEQREAPPPIDVWHLIPSLQFLGDFAKVKSVFRAFGDFMVIYIAVS